MVSGVRVDGRIESCFFFFQAEDGIRDHCVTGVQTCALPIYFSLRQGPAFYTDRQRHEFFTAQISLRLRPCFLYCPLLVAAAPPLSILTNSRCGSAPAFCTAHFSLRQGPAFYTGRQRHEFFTARISLRQIGRASGRERV